MTNDECRMKEFYRSYWRKEVENIIFLCPKQVR